MNYRVTIGLVFVLALVVVIGVIVSKSGGGGTPTRVQVPPQFFYQVAQDDINKVVIDHKGTTYRFVTDTKGTWRFDDANGALVNLDRWGGVTLLLSGPQYRRKLSVAATDLTRYGLEKPTTTITIGLKNIGNVEINVGDATPDGSSHYTQFKPLVAQAQADPGIYLVDSSWGNVMARLVTEPPYVPTPAPPATPTPEAPPPPTSTPSAPMPALSPAR